MTDFANDNSARAARSCLEQQTVPNELEKQELTNWAQSELPVSASTQPSSAERFVNIAELRTMIYSRMAGPRTDQIRDFAGFFLASKVMYAETEAELVRLRCKSIKDRLAAWSKVYGDGNVSISNPRCFSDLNTATVTLSLKLFESRLTPPAKDFVPIFPQVNVALDRLEFHIASSDKGLSIRMEDRTYGGGIRIICVTAGEFRYELFQFSCRMWIMGDLFRAYRVDFYWGSENIQTRGVSSNKRTNSPYKSQHGWYPEMIEEAGLSVVFSPKHDAIRPDEIQPWLAYKPRSSALDRM